VTAGTIAGKPVAHPDVETAFVGNEAVLLNVESGLVYALNSSAAAVWVLLDGEHSAAAIADELADLYGQTADDLLGDVEAALGDFATQGLLPDQSVAGVMDSRARVLPPPPDP
jgi:hypothetical protein